ncbi:hypothetical protein M422DRAFT_249797 [Sphaerobolus stellatus SS14]|uniref:Sulfotransferase n=1 Tax=Sphaerobolus stellatus (strain SS14) TaxID=990650 RepID=A0A0C9VHE1_SPHS4|nr:hypothetical protein M422DRAFT_249797 [Sphaerobolus stellatus SS14]
MAANDFNKIPKIIGLGLGRTGTSSLLFAFESICIKPAYHVTSIIKRKAKGEFDQWRKIALGVLTILALKGGTVEEILKLLDPYPVVLDYPAAMYPELLYEAYPRCEIYSGNDSAKWALSVQNTFKKRREQYKTSLNSPDPFWKAWYAFVTEIIDEEFVKHTEKVKKAVPADKLHIYEVNEG